VLNLTIPAAHAEIGLRAIAAGKHLYGETPLALTTAEARSMRDAAAAAGVRIGCAPDTVLGTGIQTARAVLDSGRIGDPIGASVHWSNPGHETWHPAPAFYFQPGGGPLFDMGPYYLTSLVTRFGPVVRVSGTVGRSARERTVATGPNAGAPVAVDVDTHVTALLEHAGGTTSTVTMSFELWATRVPPFEVYGTAGTIAVPDPNLFSDPVSVAIGSAATPEPAFVEVPVAAGYADAGRGVGLSDLARAIETGRPHRASGELAFHVLEVMESIIRAGQQHAVIELTSTVKRPDAVAPGTDPWNW
jgi:predicted dehydrogenase